MTLKSFVFNLLEMRGRDALLEREKEEKDEEHLAVLPDSRVDPLTLGNATE